MLCRGFKSDQEIQNYFSCLCTHVWVRNVEYFVVGLRSSRKFSDNLKPDVLSQDELFAMSHKQTKHFILQNHSLSHQYCGTCNEKIEADSKRLNHENNFWHADSVCFKCSSCSVSLVGRSFLPKDRNIFCSVQCKRKYFNQ